MNAPDIFLVILKVRVGRMDIALEYNEEECTVDSFTVIREDGTRIEVVREKIGHNDPFGKQKRFSKML